MHVSMAMLRTWPAKVCAGFGGPLPDHSLGLDCLPGPQQLGLPSRTPCAPICATANLKQAQSIELKFMPA